jgi:hypothetical protein
MRIGLVPLVAAASAALLLVTTTHALMTLKERPRLERPEPAQPAEPLESVSSVRCSIFHARFGGPRARLVKVVGDRTNHFVVLDMQRSNPAIARTQRNWLESRYGDAEVYEVGQFPTPEAALEKASELCPPHLRCWPGDAGCGSFEHPFSHAFRL